MGAATVLGLSGCAAQGTSAGKAEPESEGVQNWARSLNVDIASTLPGNTSEDIAVEETKECDILVIGGGCSGANTAIRAGELGKRVILVEKTHGRRTWQKYQDTAP